LIAKYPQDDRVWVATPTSSARSLSVTDRERTVPAFGGKLSLFRQMGGASRSMVEARGARAGRLTQLLDEVRREAVGQIATTGKPWDILPEPYAMLPPEMSPGSGGGGYIYRDLSKVKEGNDIVIPWYALVARRAAAERWIDELYRYSGRGSKSEFVWKD